MDKSLKNKNSLVIVFELVIIALSVIGITFAAREILNNRTKTVLIGEEYNVDYKGEKTISFNGLEPISDSKININTKDNVMRIEFSVKGVKTNKDENKLIYDVMLDEMNIDCSLLNKYTKWNLYKNGTLLSSGSLDPSFDGDVLGKNMHLTNIQESLPTYQDDYDNYVLLFWISESCDNLETCELIDQSSIINSKMDMKVFIALYSGNKKTYIRVPNNDNSCANKPELASNMVGVKYKDGVWVVADTTNSNKNNLWYDYSNSIWANAVMVKNNKYNKVGMEIKEEDVLGYYVWIPRYRYKLWNVNNLDKDSYNAYEDGINIIFENGLGKVENEEITNDKYITHPVFGNDLRGIWVSKYEISKKDNEYYFIPNTEVLHNLSLEDYQKIISTYSEKYSNNNSNIHMINNLEWGSALYLSHSKYGVCKGDGCSSIGVNASYISGSNKQDTTTRNVYGIYDMAGASSEYVLGENTIGTGIKELILSNGNTWGNEYITNTDRDYIIRGGIDSSIYHTEDMSMSYVESATRVAIMVK